MLGVVNDAPVPNDVPPVNAEYKLIVPALAVAPNTAVPVPQRLACVLAVMVGIAFTVTSMLADESKQPKAFLAAKLYAPLTVVLYCERVALVMSIPLFFQR